MNYGKELILDLHDCDITKFTKESITAFFIGLCFLIDMDAEDLHFWESTEEEPDPKTTGISAIQFIITSNITIHALPLMKCLYLNLFSCKEFDTHTAIVFTQEWFRGLIASTTTVPRI